MSAARYFGTAVHHEYIHFLLRNVMLKGLRLNPESKYLWWEVSFLEIDVLQEEDERINDVLFQYFRFEMLYVDKVIETNAFHYLYSCALDSKAKKGLAT